MSHYVAQEYGEGVGTNWSAIFNKMKEMETSRKWDLRLLTKPAQVSSHLKSLQTKFLKKKEAV